LSPARRGLRGYLRAAGHTGSEWFTVLLFWRGGAVMRLSLHDQTMQIA